MWEFVFIDDNNDDDNGDDMIMMMAMIMSPGGSELDPLVEESPIVELAEKTRLGDRVCGVTLSTNIFECSFKYLIVFVSLYTAVHKEP